MSTYIPFGLVQEVLRLPPATEEQHRFANRLTGLGLGRSFLEKGAERGNARSRSDHDDGFRGIRGQLEVGVANMNRHMETIVLVAWARDDIVQTVWIWMGLSMLLLLQG